MSGSGTPRPGPSRASSRRRRSPRRRRSGASARSARGSASRGLSWSAIAAAVGSGAPRARRESAGAASRSRPARRSCRRRPSTATRAALAVRHGALAGAVRRHRRDVGVAPEHDRVRARDGRPQSERDEDGDHRREATASGSPPRERSGPQARSAVRRWSRSSGGRARDRAVGAIEVAHVRLARRSVSVGYTFDLGAVHLRPPHRDLDPPAARPVEPDVERARSSRSTSAPARPSTTTSPVAACSRMIDSSCAGTPPRRGRPGGRGRPEGLPHRRQPHRHPRQQPAERLVARRRVLEGDRQPLRDLGRDRAVEERHPQPLRQPRPTSEPSAPYAARR